MAHAPVEHSPTVLRTDLPSDGPATVSDTFSADGSTRVPSLHTNEELHDHVMPEPPVSDELANESTTKSRPESDSALHLLFTLFADADHSCEPDPVPLTESNPNTRVPSPVPFAAKETDTAPTTRVPTPVPTTTATSRPPKNLQFWLIFVSLMISVFLSAMEVTAVSTALPSIVNALSGSHFSWAGSAYSLASTAFIPLTGGLAEIFGRRPTILFMLVLFTLGSALCGSAKSMTWFIAARTIQGLGGGGVLSSASIIVSDLVSLKERGAYNGLIGLAWAFALASGPLVGGALADKGEWRWLFYLNLPVCGVSMLLVLCFLRLPTPPGTLKEKLRRMDWIGNALIMSSTTSVVLALTWGGVDYPWSSFQVILSLVLGMLGLVAFFVYEAKWASHPIVPYSILRNWSSASGYVQNFIIFFLQLGVAYYLPVYYQACKDASPVKSGVNGLGLSLSVAPAVVCAGVSVTVVKRYRPQIWMAWIIIIIAFGLFTTLEADTATVRAIGFSMFFGAGAGTLGSTLYFPVLAPLPVTENAHALAFFSFLRSFAGVWGIAIGAAVLQNELGTRLPASFLSSLASSSDGQGLEVVYAIIPQIRFMEQPTKDLVRQAFGESIRVLWKVLLGVSFIGFLAMLLMQNLPLQDVMDEKWSLEQAEADEVELKQGAEVQVLPV